MQGRLAERIRAALGLSDAAYNVVVMNVQHANHEEPDWTEICDLLGIPRRYNRSTMMRIYQEVKKEWEK